MTKTSYIYCLQKTITSRNTFIFLSCLNVLFSFVHFHYVEYSTEKDLLKSLEIGSVDQIWLFECNAKANFPLMVVKVHNEAPYIGVQITTQAKTEDGPNFPDLVYINDYSEKEEGDHHGHDDEDLERPLNGSLVEFHIQSHGPDVRNFHFLFYFRHQLCYCPEFSDTKTPILHELNRKKTAKIEISTLKLVLTIASPLTILWRANHLLRLASQSFSVTHCSLIFFRPK